MLGCCIDISTVDFCLNGKERRKALILFYPFLFVFMNSWCLWWEYVFMPWLLEDGAKDAKTSQSFRHFCTLPVFTVLILTRDHHNCSDISVLFLYSLYLYSQETSQSFRRFCTLPVFTVLVLTSDHHNCSDISVLFLGLLYLYSQMSRIFPFFGGVGWRGPPLYVVCIRDRQGSRTCAEARRAFAEKFGL